MTTTAPYGLTWPLARTQLKHLGYSEAQIRACSEACPGPGMSHDLPGGLHVAGTDSRGLWYVGGIPAEPAPRRPDVHDHEEHLDGTVTGCPACCRLCAPAPSVREEFYAALDRASGRPGYPGLDWLLAVIPVVDQALDDLAPEVFRQDNEASRIANMYRRFAAGPVSEAAEAIDALNGMTGGNPRKGITHTRTQLLAEAADTAFSALLAIQSQTKDINETWMIFTEAAAKAYSRVPDANRPDRGRQSLADYYAPPGPDGRIAHDNGS